jgi:NAD(P)H dehydrogenase (quinone)
LKLSGVRVRKGDFTDPASLRQAFEGARQVMLVSSNARASGGDPLVQHKAAIDAARAVGAQRIVYTSQMAANAASAFPPARDHAATEDMLAQSGLAWTALRHGFYAQSGITLMGEAWTTHVIEAPADGKVAWTTHADLAEADAAILAEEGRFDGPTPPLTASEALDMADLAAIASDLGPNPVSRKTLTDDEFRSKMAARGLPDGAMNLASGLYGASRNGEFSAIHPALAELLGRAPTGMRTIIAQRLNEGN